MNKVTKIHERVSSPILYGLIIALLIMLLGVLTVSLLLLGNQLDESSLSMAVYFIHGASLLAGGIMTGRGKGRRGWYYGGLLGLIYWLLIILIGFLSMNTSIHLNTLITAGLCLLTGAIGGMIGVNISRS